MTPRKTQEPTRGDGITPEQARERLRGFIEGVADYAGTGMTSLALHALDALLAAYEQAEARADGEPSEAIKKEIDWFSVRLAEVTAERDTAQASEARLRERVVRLESLLGKTLAFLPGSHPRSTDPTLRDRVLFELGAALASTPDPEARCDRTTEYDGGSHESNADPDDDPRPIRRRDRDGRDADRPDNGPDSLPRGDSGLDHHLEPASPTPSPDREPGTRFLADVQAEVERARAKFPGNRHQCVAFSEEAGEVANALLEHGNGSAELWDECVQAAAMALRLAEEGDGDFDGEQGYANTPEASIRPPAPTDREPGSAG